MPQYKLTYGDSRGLAETIRYIFAYAKVEYEDVRLPLEPLSDERKKELGLPWGQIPILEIDGKIVGQSIAIARYLARKFKIAGVNELEELKCDEIADAWRDYGTKWAAMYPYLRDPNGGDQAKKAEILKNLLEVETPKDLSRFNTLLDKSPNGFFVPSGLTWVDIMVAYNLTQLEAVFRVEILKDYPALQRLVQKVENAPGIKEWIAKRPKTQF